MTVLCAECGDDEDCVPFRECRFARELAKNRRLQELKNCGILAGSVRKIIVTSLETRVTGFWWWRLGGSESVFFKLNFIKKF